MSVDLNESKGLQYNKSSIRHGLDDTTFDSVEDNSVSLAQQSSDYLPLSASTVSLCEALGKLHMHGKACIDIDFQNHQFKKFKFSDCLDHNCPVNATDFQW